MVLVLVAAGCLLRWADGSPVVPASTAASTVAPTLDPTLDPTPAATVTPVQATVPRPVRLDIPAISVSTSLERLGLQADGTVEVPRIADNAGWFQLGTPPGGAGSSVILGHVDSTDGPAVFAGLKDLRAGHEVRVGRTDGSTVTFRVVSVETYPNAEFPADEVYGRLDGRRLNLVTCGGAYDSSKGGYQSNVVVYTRQLDVTR
ncbi:Sortase family protein [Nocardioides dokdonensis FR1436]|uniref:Sortase family protein n=1 Tax=Nocardioides dokdonensis FR1436 TaxID=1300347 RepID=A0A1A9GGL6_9ACTN|nr:Sortase family protein [Nocardioides dokdonensis FR1436]